MTNTKHPQGEKTQGFISISVLVITFTLSTLLGILALSIQKTNTSLIHYQWYIQHYYTTDAALKLALTQLAAIPQLETHPTKAWCYSNIQTGYPINPFGNESISLWRYSDLIFAISNGAQERIILVGHLHQSQTHYTLIHAYD
jgi:hypothetical protein